ncbi:MAG: FliG C-terminal domain-containing protein [Phycisphaerae bacterium]
MPSTLRKAALLLRSLDPQTAGELLAAAPPEAVKQIASELVSIDNTGQAGAESDPAAEFLGLLTGTRRPDLQSFVRDVVANAVGQEKCEQILGEVDRLVKGRDPFLPIRQADVSLLAAALRGQHPQAAALVLMELDPEKSAALIPLLDESIRGEAVRRMILGERVSPEAQGRVAAMVRDRLEDLASSSDTPAAASGSPDARLRRVALLMRRLRKDLRDSLLESIKQRSPDEAREVQDLMVTWDDLPVLSDRSLQDILRTMDAGGLAMALHGADEEIDRKIRNNISERAAAMVEEEISLMRQPKIEDVEAAREKILTELRQLNAAGELTFEEPPGRA